MVDTVRTLAALQALLPDNTSGDISPQDIRDFLVSVYPPNGLGLIYTADPGYGSNATVNIVANACRYMRVIGSGAITSVGMYVTNQSGNIAVAHYSNSGSGRSAVPDERQATTGSIACPPVGYQEVSLATTIEPGDWLAISADSLAAIMTAGEFNSVATALASGRNYAQTNAHPCPATPGSLDAGNAVTRILVGVP